LDSRPDSGAVTSHAVVLLAFMIAAGFGCLYEIYEWVSDMTFGTDHQPDNTDTMMDITANAGGGLIAVSGSQAGPPGAGPRQAGIGRFRSTGSRNGSQRDDTGAQTHDDARPWPKRRKRRPKSRIHTPRVSVVGHLTRSGLGAKSPSAGAPGPRWPGCRRIAGIRATGPDFDRTRSRITMPIVDAPNAGRGNTPRPHTSHPRDA